mmetsp:Transcript_19369/g.41675  ORF Transcript_19369/g.41675 Transcript_19369/m.41675 type:complete len:109 (-) Transcript_19369:180-506(-)
MITFGLQRSAEQKIKSKRLAKIRTWVEHELDGGAYADVTVMVNELQCLEPGCAPVETVITLLDERKPLSFKIFKAATDVEAAEVVTQLHESLAGHSTPQHMASTMPVE